MRESRIAVGCLFAALSLAGCSGTPDPPTPAATSDLAIPSGAPDATATVGGVQVRVAILHQHDVVVARRSGDGRWEGATTVLTLPDRECGAIDATAAGDGLAVTLACDASYAADTAPTRSVALVSQDLDEWDHHDLSGEAFLPPAVSPSGEHVVWPQGDGLLTWSADDGFQSADGIDGDAISVSDSGAVRAAVVVADGAGTSLAITEDGASPILVPLPAHQNGGDAEYDGVVFLDPDTLRVRTPRGVPDLTVVRFQGTWVLRFPTGGRT